MEGSLLTAPAIIDLPHAVLRSANKRLDLVQSLEGRAVHCIERKVRETCVPIAATNIRDTVVLTTDSTPRRTRCAPRARTWQHYQHTRRSSRASAIGQDSSRYMAFTRGSASDRATRECGGCAQHVRSAFALLSIPECWMRL